MRSRDMNPQRVFRAVALMGLAVILALLAVGLVTAQGQAGPVSVTAASHDSRQSRAAGVATGALMRVTIASHGDRDSQSPSVNADGTVVAFSSDSDLLSQGIPYGQDEIWLYDTTTMTVTRITTASHADRWSGHPSLSADGKRIAFESDSDFSGQGIPLCQDEVWLYDTTTLSLTRITVASHAGRSSRSPRISADGTKIVFFSSSDLLGQGTSGRDEVWLYDITTMIFTRVTTASHPSRDSLWPSVNADGTVVAFYSDSDFLGQGIADDQWEIWLYDTAAMTVTRVTTASDSSRGSAVPSLNADGTKVAFYSDSDFLGQGIADEEWEIWLYDTAAMTVTRVTTASYGNRDSFFPVLSSDGMRVAFHSDSDFLGQGIPDSQDEAWLCDTITLGLVRLTAASQAGRDSTRPSLNADGTRVAFHSDSDFLDQGVPDDQTEIWLWRQHDYHIHLPLVLRQAQ